MSGAVFDVSGSCYGQRGKGKIRFVFAWAVSRILKQARKYVCSNMYSETAHVHQTVKKSKEKIKALESAVIVPYDIMCRRTEFPETLKVTESRQCRIHVLLHITDAAFKLSLKLEHARVSVLNTTMLQLHGENLIQIARVS